MTSEEDVYNALKYRVVVEPNGTRKYFNAAGQLHHDEGPAVYWSYGLKEWWQNGLRHRTDGPAAVYSDGAAEWWLYGVAYSHTDFQAQLTLMGLTACIPKTRCTTR